MKCISKLWFTSAVLAGTLLVAPYSPGQDKKAAVPAPAPIPAEILMAKKVFISNAGTDAAALKALLNSGDRDAAYNQFYDAVASWGRYRLVSTPADSDIVAEISFTAPMDGCGKFTSFGPQLNLVLFDARSHFRLWSFVEPVEGAIRQSTWDKNFSSALESLLSDWKRIVSPQS